MAVHEVEISPSALGAKPFVLIELEKVNEDDTLSLRLKVGGGFALEDVEDVLLSVVESLLGL